jgi:hypothetical protein
MTAGEEIQSQIFENLLSREGKTLTITRGDVVTDIECLINTGRQDSDKPGTIDFSSREHVEIWVWNDAISPMIKVQESLIYEIESKRYRVQKRFPGPIKTALICKVEELG